jgi:H+-transporting ATPase
MSDVTEKNTSGSSHDAENEKGEQGAGPQANSEEYAQLIEFIRSQKNATSDEDAGDGSHTVKKRSWITPWKTREVRVNKDGEEEEVAARVPASW